MISTIITSVITGGISGLAVNLITEDYKRKKNLQFMVEVFEGKTKQFIKLTNKFLYIQAGGEGVTQLELDQIGGIRNLKRAFLQESSYSDSIEKIITFEIASIPKDYQEKALSIQDKIHSIKILIHQIDIESDYARYIENHYIKCFEAINNHIRQINILLES